MYDVSRSIHVRKSGYRHTNPRTDTQTAIVALDHFIGATIINALLPYTVFFITYTVANKSQICAYFLLDLCDLDLDLCDLDLDHV